MPSFCSSQPKIVSREIAKSIHRNRKYIWSTLHFSAHLAHLEWPFPYLLGVGLVLRLHSVRSRATSWVTPTAVMSSFSCWFHVFLGRPRRLAPGIASSITLRVTLSASRLWTCPNQRRRPQRITASIGVMCRMRRMSSFRMWSRFDTPRIPRSILISVVAIFLLLVTFIALIRSKLDYSSSVWDPTCARTFTNGKWSSCTFY